MLPMQSRLCSSNNSRSYYSKSLVNVSTDTTKFVPSSVIKSLRRRFSINDRYKKCFKSSRAVKGERSRPTDATATTEDKDDNKSNDSGRFFLNFFGFPFPLVPLLYRETVVEKIAEDVYAFEQKQGIGFGLGVSTNVRMTVIRLKKDGSLFVKDPIAPTEECLNLMRETFGADYVVSSIVLGTTMYEHKIFVPAFARKHKNAKVFVVPGQFSFPIQLPNALLGIQNATELTTTSTKKLPDEWQGEIDYELLGTFSLFWNQYRYSEGTFYHKKTKTLLVTDAAVFVEGDKPPLIIPQKELSDLGSEDSFTIRLLRALNFRGGRNVKRANDVDDVINGWRRMTLFSLFIAPDAKNIINPSSSFNAMKNKFVVSPIVFIIVFDFFREEIKDWKKRCQRFAGANRVVASHFPVPLTKANGRDFFAAFKFADSASEIPSYYFDEEDLASLKLLQRVLNFIKVYD
jgi:hypothetical protein